MSVESSELKTPTKASFTPRELRTPNKEQPGIARTIYHHASTHHSHMQDWKKICAKGTITCQAINRMKLFELEDSPIPEKVQVLTDSLTAAVESLQIILDGLHMISDQLSAAAKLQPSEEPVLNTWSVSKIAKSADKIYKMCLKEYELKKCIVENIAHCRDEGLTEVYASAWELEPYIDQTLFSFFYMETMGLT